MAAGLLAAAPIARAQGPAPAPTPTPAPAPAPAPVAVTPLPTPAPVPTAPPASASTQLATKEVPAGGAVRLEDAVRSALANNERSKKAPLRVEAASGQLDRARDAFFPTLAAQGSTSIRGQEDRSGRSTTTTSSVVLTQPIFTPSAFPQYSQQSHNLEAEKWGSAQDRRALSFDTAKSFFQAITAERVLEAAQRRVERAQANLDNAEARAAAQLASVNDSTRAELEVIAAKREVAIAEGNAVKARLQLGFLMGQKVTGPLVAPTRTDSAAESVENASNNQLRSAQDRRPDVRASHEKSEALRYSAKEPLYRLAPSLSAQGRLTVLPDPLPTERAVDQLATLNLSWNIFDAGFRYADRRRLLAQAASQSLDESLLRRSVEVDVGIALAQLKAARESYRLSERSVAAAQVNQEETEILYRQGLARAIELTDANSKRFDAEVNKASAKLSMEQAYLELRYALGYGPLDEDGT